MAHCQMYVRYPMERQILHPEILFYLAELAQANATLGVSTPAFLGLHAGIP